MDIISIWPTRLAEETAPDEIDLAPIMAEAFIEGGQAREELFYQVESGALGGFGAGEGMALFPWILHTIAAASGLILPLLSYRDEAKEFLAIIVDIFSIEESLARKNRMQALPDDPNAPLKRALATLEKELRATPIPPEQQEGICYRVLSAFLRDPENAAAFVQQIGGTSGE